MFKAGEAKIYKTTYNSLLLLASYLITFCETVIKILDIHRLTGLATAFVKQASI